MNTDLDKRFSFGDACCFDMDSNTIIDLQQGQAARYTPVSATEGAVLGLLVRAYPDAVSKEQLCSLINADCDNSDVRRIINKLKKRHPLLKLWIPRGREGEYRLREPISANQPEIPPDVPEIQESCALKSTGICVRPNFVADARQDIFNALEEAFQKSHVAFLQGIGGIGKSEAAKHWAMAQKNAGLFDTVVFAQLNSESSNSNVQSLLVDDTVFVISGPFRPRDEEESTDGYFHRKLAKIKQLTDERTLIVIDNYDMDDPALEELFTGSYRLLVTTRNRQRGYDFPQIPVTEIQNPAYLKEIFFRNLENERDDIDRNDPYLEKLFALVSHHTLTIEIIAKSLVNSVDTPESVYRSISDPQRHGLLDGMAGLVERSFSEEPLSPFECIRRLFNLSRLEQDRDFAFKSQVLVFLAAMPTRGIELPLFRKWSDSRIIHAKNSLVRKSWLRQDTANGVTLISMHPLIREIVWHELEPSLEKCAKIIKRIMEDDLLGPELDGLYHQSRKVKEQYETVAISLLVSFPPKGLIHIDFYTRLQMLFHYTAHSDYALGLACTIKDILEQSNETDSWRYGNCLLRIGLAYEALFRDENRAFAYLKQARCNLEKTAVLHEERMKLAITHRALATLYCRLGWDKHMDIPADEVEYNLNRAIQIAEQLYEADFCRMRMRIFLGTVYVWRSKYEAICGNLEQAKKWIDQAENEFIRKNYVNIMDKTAILDIRALIHSAKKEYAAEITNLKEAMLIHTEGFGKYHRAGVERAIKLATAYRNNHQPEEAILILTQYQKIAEEMLGADAPLTRTIRTQLAELSET